MNIVGSNNGYDSRSTSTVPMVSVIVPTYNRGYCIAACLRSVLDQSFKNFEIIVVDDASKDDTRAQVDSVGDPRIRYVAHEKNKGGAAARNSGIRVAGGEFIAFLDSDDYWHPEKLDKQISALQKLGLGYGLSYTWISCVDEEGKEVLRINPDIDGDCFQEMLVSNFIGSFSNIVVRKALLLEVGALDETFRSCQDWDLFIRLTRRAAVHCLPEYAVRYLISTSDKHRISTNSQSVIQGHTGMLVKYSQEYAVLPTKLKLRAFRVYMGIFANSGSVRNTWMMGIKRLGCSAQLGELLNSGHLMLRALKRCLVKKMQAVRRVR
jgi:glycosyltransferase involved in cell wall biosynthesis